MRVSAFESGIFTKVKDRETVARGNFLQLFSASSQFLKYLRCILIGLPVWFVAGILMTFE